MRGEEIAAAAGRTYLTTVPQTSDVPPGRVVVHNSVKPAKRLGVRGFRAWLQAPDDTLEQCDCGWAAPTLDVHYRITIAAWNARHQASRPPEAS